MLDASLPELVLALKRAIRLRLLRDGPSVELCVTVLKSLDVIDALMAGSITVACDDLAMMISEIMSS